MIPDNRSPLMKRLAEIMPKKPEPPASTFAMTCFEMHPIRVAAESFASWMGDELPANDEELRAMLWVFGEILNGPIFPLSSDDPFGDFYRFTHPGINVTAIVPPESGWPIAMYCSLCKKTVFMLSLWAVKPDDCDYIRINEMCVSDEHNVAHNLEFTFGDHFSSFAHSTRFMAKGGNK